MSVKDQRYYRTCVICYDTLPGTDDGLEVYESLISQIEEFDAGRIENVCCTLCGEPVSIEQARVIAAKGEPKLYNAKNSYQN